eukprot:scaffold3086_cov393-Prasinococcus_capsulatus_cf.AAC.4
MEELKPTGLLEPPRATVFVCCPTSAPDAAAQAVAAVQAMLLGSAVTTYSSGYDSLRHRPVVTFCRPVTCQPFRFVAAFSPTRRSRRRREVTGREGPSALPGASAASAALMSPPATGAQRSSPHRAGAGARRQAGRRRPPLMPMLVRRAPTTSARRGAARRGAAASRRAGGARGKGLGGRASTRPCPLARPASPGVSAGCRMSPLVGPFSPALPGPCRGAAPGSAQGRKEVSDLMITVL